MSRHTHTIGSFLNVDDFSQLAKDSGFVKRQSSKFCPQNFVLALLNCVSSGECSFFNIADNLGKVSARSLCRQAIFLRINDSCLHFLELVVSSLISRQSKVAKVPEISTRCGLKRVLVEDSSIQKMNNHNSDDFPGHGNQNGKTASFKLDLAYNLLDGRILYQQFSASTAQDRTLGKKILHEVGPGDLVLRDMGYFAMADFIAIEERGADWMSRLPVQLTVILANGKALETALVDARNNFIDCEVTIGKKDQKCRLVGYRADPKIASERRRRRLEENKRKGRKTESKKQANLRDNWHLMLTSVSKERIAPKDLMALYRTRWDIEIRFRAWKGSLKLDKTFNRKSNRCHLMSLVYASFIHQVLSMTLWTKLGAVHRQERISIENLASSLSSLLQKLPSFHPKTATIFHERHVLKEKRKQESYKKKGLKALT